MYKKWSILFSHILISPVKYQAFLLSWGLCFSTYHLIENLYHLETFHLWVSDDGVSLIIYISKKESEIFFKKPK